MWPFRNAKAEPAKIEPPQPNGIFSTDFEWPKKNIKQSDIDAVLRKSFQKDHTDFMPVNASGQTYAMDDADCTPNIGLKYSNAYGAGVPWAQLSWYASQGFIGYQNAAMIAQQWLVNKACVMPALDATRNGYDITINDGTELDPDDLADIRRKDKEYNVIDRCIDQIYYGRVFGIRIAKFIIESSDPKYYEKPFNPDGIKKGSYKGIVQIDPYWITPELDFEACTPGTQFFYEPTWWRVNGQRIHRTHLVIMRNALVPDILKPTYLYGGISVPQKIAERVYAAERTANEAPMLAMTKRMIVLKVDTSQAVANVTEFQNKLTGISNLWNNFGNRIIGGEEEIDQFDTALGDLDTTIMTQYQLVSAGSDVPATKLLGTSPKGFNATGEYEAKSYRQFLETQQKCNLTPLLDRHHLCLIRSEFPELAKNKDFRIEHVWKSTDSPTAKEVAEINTLRADTDNKWVQAGAVDGTDIRKRIVTDPDSGFNGFEEIVEGGPGDRIAQQEANAPLEEPVQVNNKQKDVAKDSADFEESEHPRDDDGKR